MIKAGGWLVPSNLLSPEGLYEALQFTAPATASVRLAASGSSRRNSAAIVSAASTSKR